MEREQQNEHLPKEQGTSLKTRQKKAETRGLKLVREKRYIIAIEILPITGYSNSLSAESLIGIKWDRVPGKIRESQGEFFFLLLSD